MDTSDLMTYEQDRAKLIKKLRPFIFTDRTVELVMDPRTTAEEDSDRMRGRIGGVSATTDMIALEQTEEEYVETTRRRQSLADGWLVSVEMRHVLDVEAV